MIFSSIGFVLFLVLLLGFFIKRCNTHAERLIFISALCLKISAGIGVGLLYQMYYSGGDTFNYLHDLKLLSDGTSQNFLFSDQPRAWFFVQLVYPLYKLSFTNYWLLATNLSVLSLLATWAFYQEVKQLDIKPWTIIIALFFVPSVVFWTSGLLKETLSNAVIYLILFNLLRIKRKTTYPVIYIIGLILLTILLFYLKYYLFAPIVIISVLFLVIHFTKKKLSIPLLITFSLSIVILITIGVSVLHPNMNLDFFLEALRNNYTKTILHSSNNALIPIFYNGSLKSFVTIGPHAILTGLFRPTIFEHWNLLSLLLSIENSIVLFLFIISVWAKIKQPFFRHKSLLILCSSLIIFLAIVLTIASPNYGSLVRYRTAYFPLFVLLILQGIKKDLFRMKNIRNKSFLKSALERTFK